LDICVIDWNALGTWVAAVGTIGAFWVVRRQARDAAKQYLAIQAERLAERAEAARIAEREQASKVCFWVGTTKDPLVSPSWQVIHVCNANLVPMYDAKVSYRVAAETFLDPRTFGNLPPGDTEVSENVVPGSVKLTFRDGSNVYWRRGSDGALAKWSCSGTPDETDQWTVV
jgi:hypothetical protein